MVENETFEESLNRFLTTITAELESLKKITALYAPVLAPGFNAVDCLNPNENRLSAVIAMLLDPNGGHGQGFMFLRQFVSVLIENVRENARISEKLIELLKMTCTGRELEVATTHISESQRRIDILLHFNTSSAKRFALAIENKPWTYDQKNQLNDYDIHLKKKFGKNYFQIYLSGNGTPPSEESLKPLKQKRLEMVGRFMIMSYSQLRIWCELCAEKCQAPRLRYFIEDFASYIRDKFEGGIPVMEEKVVIDNALKPQNIGAAVAVGFAWPEIAKRLFTKLVELVIKDSGINSNEWKLEMDIKELDTDSYGWKHKIDFDLLEKDSCFWIQKSKWKNYRYEFAFDFANARNFFFGISKCSEEVKDIPNDILIKFKKSGLVGDGQSKWWPCYQYFGDHYRDWSMSEKPWVGIKEGGDTVKEIAKRLKLLIDICTSDIDKLEAELNSVSSLPAVQT